ncbi:MAG TPA: DUF3300 domain-containing protein [Verrucomicrobiae bacterium]|nr:DUF3300 domain-containing protein [Verrucomicrobiae bacterium]
MIVRHSYQEKFVAALVVAVLILWPSFGAAQNQPQIPAQDPGNPTEAATQTPEQLQALVAPIALYPDALVAQILTASTFPDQLAVADYWVQQNKNLTGSALMQAVDKQSWDPSVKALTEFPSVLDNLAKNLAWTSSLGEAYHNQQAEVMTAIQTCRAQAKAKGNLQTNSQITVVQQSPQTIVIQPTNPQVVYVPQYNPAIVYGYPYVVPSYVAPTYTTGDVVAAGIIGFGAGIAVGAMMAGGCCGWGYSSWNCGWHGTAVVYHGGAYYGNAAWHGGYYNGGYHNSYGYYNHYGNNYNNANHYGNNYNNYNHNNYSNYNKNSGNTYNRNTTNNVNVNRNASSSNSWAQHNSGMSSHSDAFSSGRSGGSDGWSSRAESSRGWGSMRSSGFSGGRFGGGGGGRFGGGGFRR